MFYNLLPQFIVIPISYNPCVIFIYYILIFTSFYYIFLLLSNLHRLMFYILLIYNWGGFSISLLLSFVLHKGIYNNLRHLYNEIQPVVWN